MGGIGLEPIERPPGLEEAGLGSVLGVAGVPGDDVGGTKGDLLVPPHKDLVRSRVPALSAPNQGMFVRNARGVRPVDCIGRVQSWSPCGRRYSG